MRPGPNILSRETPPARSAAIDVGRTFWVGLAEKGSSEDAPKPLRSLDDFTRNFGQRLSTSVLYDAVEEFFREGGGELLISRVLGTAPISAFVDLSDGTGPSLRVSAESPGSWGNALNVQVTAGDAGGEFKLVITHDTDTTINYTSPSLVDKAAAIAWAATDQYIRCSDVNPAKTDPSVVAAQSLATGTDDSGTIADAHWLTALNAFPRDLGPGQVAAPGRTTTAGIQQLYAHAKANGRYAVPDHADVSSDTTLKSNAAAARNADARYGFQPFAPWLKIPGLTSGTTRTVPPSALVCAVISRNDGQGHSPNEAAAGELGKAQYATDVSQPAWTDTQRESMNAAGVNVIRLLNGRITIYGYRSMVAPVTDPKWVNAGNGRLWMAIAAKANAIAENFVFRQLDGRRTTIAEFGGILTGMLLPYWESGSLYGESARDAFNVDVGPAVNTDLTISDGQLKAVLSLRISPFAEMVTIEIVKVAPTEAVA